jgi:PAS domain S-box-containing protein
MQHNGFPLKLGKGPRRRISIQILALVLVAVVVGGVALFLEYRTGIEQQRARLSEFALSQARLIEEITAHHLEVFRSSAPADSVSGSEEAFQITLNELRRAHGQFQGFGETGEFTLATREGDQMVFLLSHRHEEVEQGASLSMGDSLGEPMAAALSGRSGTMVGTDYRGSKVLAAFEPVSVAGSTVGVVAKMDYAEVRRPFLNVLWSVGLVGALVIFVGSLALYRLGEPLIQRLEESELRFRRFFEDSQEAMVLSSPDGKVMEANLAALEFFGMAREEMIGRDVTESYGTPEDRARFLEEMTRTGSVKDFYSRFRLLDGTEKDVIFSSSAREQADGTVVFESVLRDISAQKRAEDALRESEAQFRSLAESSPSAIFIEQGGEVRFANPVAAESIGYTEEEILSPDFDWRDVVVPDTAAPVVEAYNRHQRGEEVPTYEYQIRRRDGTVLDVVSATRIIQYRGEPAILGTITDITAQKAIQRELERRERLYHTIFEFGNDGHLLLRDGKFVEGNLRALNMFGVSAEVLAGLTPWDLSPPLQPDGRSSRSKAEDFLAKTMAGTPQVFEWTHLRPDGSLLNVDVSLTRVDLEEGPAVYAVMRDLTERKEAERALMESLETSADLAEAIPAGLFIYEYEAPDRLILAYGNREAGALTGIDVEASLGKEFDEIWPEARQFGITDRYLKVMKTGEMFETDDEAYRDERLEGVFRVHAFPLPGDRLAVSFENVTAQRRAAQEIRDTNRRLRALAARLQEIREEERTHIARELHDELGQAITSLRMDLAMLRTSLPQGVEKVAERVDAMIGVADENLALVQNISSRLRPPVLDVLGLPAAIEWLVDELKPRVPMEIRLELEADEVELDSTASTAVFRIVQEALTNMVRHSDATRAEVGLSIYDDNLLVHVADDGVGISEDGPQNPRSLGLIGMRERAKGLGGILEVGPGPGGGTRVSLTVPLNGLALDGGTDR